MTTYRELFMKRDAFLELRTLVRNELSRHPETSGGEILTIDTDPSDGSLIVTGQYQRGAEITQITHRITITEEPAVSGD